MVKQHGRVLLLVKRLDGSALQKVVVRPLRDPPVDASVQLACKQRAYAFLTDRGLPLGTTVPNACTACGLSKHEENGGVTPCLGTPK